MDKKILILAITVSFIITSIPFAEASVGWNGFLRDIGFGGTQIYEVSAVSVIPAGGAHGPEVTLLCSEGDWMNFGSPNFLAFSVDVVTNPSAVDAGKKINFQSSLQRDPASSNTGGNTHAKPIGVIGNPQFSDSIPTLAFDVEVTVSILCFSPSPLTNGATIGGEWQSTDTVALFIGYSVLNAYWLAPALTGIGAGIYLTKSKWKR